MPFNKEKFEEVLHYIISRCGNLENIGKTTLYKLLYFSDFDYFEKYEASITGEDYIKLPHGPVPKKDHFVQAIASLKAKKLVLPSKTLYHGHEQERFQSLAQPVLKHLSAQELQIITNVIGKFCNMNATQLSEFSHLDMPWKATQDDDVIDYRLVFYREPLTSVREYPEE
jgi:uncharacterized phage-associated protein